MAQLICLVCRCGCGHASAVVTPRTYYVLYAVVQHQHSSTVTVAAPHSNWAACAVTTDCSTAA
jgi:hypothetical protein